MHTCPHCKQQIEESAVFCPHCVKPVGAQRPAPPQDPDTGSTRGVGAGTGLGFGAGFDQYGGPLGPSPSEYIGQRRNGLTVIVLSILTCGIYMAYWYYEAMEDINRASGEMRINSIGLLVGIVLCAPIFLIIAQYRMDRELARLSREEGTHYRENFILWLLLTFFCGIGGFVCMAHVTGGYNAIWDKRQGVLPRPY